MRNVSQRTKLMMIFSPMISVLNYFCHINEMIGNDGKWEREERMEERERERE